MIIKLMSLVKMFMKKSLPSRLHCVLSTFLKKISSNNNIKFHNLFYDYKNMCFLLATTKVVFTI